MLARIKILLCLVLLFQPFLLMAQSQQQVQVREYKEKQQKTPLEGVSLSVQNAGSGLSDAQGQLTLQFRTLKAGDAVQVRRVDLSGYEIFNRDAVDQWTISPQQTFNLVLCRSDRFKQLRDQYLVVSSNSYANQYKKDQARLAALRKENKLQEEAYQQQLAELEENYYEQLDNLENYVDRFARIDLSELSSQEQRLVELVQQGKIDEAIELYESADYLSQYNAQVKDLKEIESAQQRLAQVEAEKLAARDKVRQAISRQVQTYQLAGGQENYRKITSLLKGVADADTTNLDAVWQYGSYCLNQNLFAEGEKYMNIYIRQSQDNRAHLSKAYAVLGELYTLMYKFDMAEKYDLLAVELGEQCVAEDSARFMPSLINAQCALYNLYTFIDNLEAADAFSDILQQRLELYYSAEPEIWWKRLVSFYNELGYVIYQLEDNYEESNKLFIKAYNIAKEYTLLYEFDSKDCIRQSIIYLCEVYYYKEQWEKMLPFMLEDLQYSLEAYAKNPDNQSMYLFSVYNNICELYFHLDNYITAQEYLQKALELLPSIRQTFDKESSAFSEMNLYDAASQLYHGMNDIEKMREYAQKTLDCYNLLPVEKQQGQEELVARNKAFLNK